METIEPSPSVYRQLIPPRASNRDLKLYLRLSVAAPAGFLVLMALVALGVGRLLNPLVWGTSWHKSDAGKQCSSYNMQHLRGCAKRCSHLYYSWVRTR